MSQARASRHDIAHPGGVIRVLQLTDTHLCKQPGGTLLGMDTDHSLQSVIDLIRRERPAVDLLLGTGDLSDHGSVEAYQRLQAYFTTLTDTHCWLPGNHDIRANMASVADCSLRLSPELRIGRWQILMLDSQVPGEVGGELGAAQLTLLRDALERAEQEGLYSLVCLHHQPITVGCQWLDEQMVADADAFFAILERFAGVKGVLWGHVHQCVDSRRGDLRMMASPSTCVQFAPGSANFKADPASPGYRWLELHEDGALESGISRVQGVKYEVDLDSGGYL